MYYDIPIHNNTYIISVCEYVWKKNKNIQTTCHDYYHYNHYNINMLYTQCPIYQKMYLCDFAVDVRTLPVYVHACERLGLFVRVGILVVLSALLSCACVMNDNEDGDDDDDKGGVRSVHCLETYYLCV